MRRSRCSILSAILPLLLATMAAVHAEPWDLREYELCRRVTLKGIRAEASGVSYSDVTNTVWVVTRRPPVLAEYTLEGRLVRTINTKNARLRDPEGITWMYEYKFAISEEGRGASDSSISIVEAAPWRDEVRPLKRIELDNIRHDKNKGLEGLTWDAKEEIFITSQEQDPVQIWGVDPDSGRAKKLYKRAKQSRDYKDFASVYKPRDDEGLYILSEPNKKVYSVDEDGDIVRRQEKRVEGRMPEGLTFTPGGEIMIIVGEPNEMFVYSSTGDCKYDRRRRNKSTESSAEDRDSEEDDSEEDASEEADSEQPSPVAPAASPVTQKEPLILSGGYCSYDQCQSGDPQGPSWCRASADNCVGSCAGWWCLGKQGPAITKMNLLPGVPPSPPKPQPRSPPPSPQALPASPPWYEISEDGFCATTSDCQVLDDGPWCRQSAENCLKCGKETAWCPISRGDNPPITRENYPQALPGVPWYYLPSLGYCATNTDCDVIHPTAWCLESSFNCVGCSAAWCPRKVLDINEDPVTRDTLPESPPEQSPPAALPQSTPRSSTVFAPPVDAAPAVEASPKSPSVEQDEDDDDDKRMVTAEGYKAIVDMIFSGLVSLNENEEILLRKYMAKKVFGDEAAEPQVNIGSMSVQQGRRLMGSASVVEISFEILAETELHAEYITGKLVEAAKAGSLEDQLATRGIHVVLVANSTVVGAGIKTKDFPKAPPLPFDTIEAHLPVVSAFEVPDDEPLKIPDARRGNDFPMNMVLSVSLGGLLCLAALLFVVSKVVMQRPQPPCKSIDLDGSKAHVPKSAALDHEQDNSVQQMAELSLAVDLEDIPSGPTNACVQKCSALEAEASEVSGVSSPTLSAPCNTV